MTIIKNNEKQNNILDIKAKLQEILALAKEIEHLANNKHPSS